MAASSTGTLARALNWTAPRRQVVGASLGALAGITSLTGRASAHLPGRGQAGRAYASSNRTAPYSVASRQIEPGDHVQAVVSAHELATNAGVEILAAGGSAADAAIAIAATLTVVEPWFSSALGGGTWALYYDARAREVTSLDGVGPVGRNATLEDYRERIGEPGMHQAILPGAWDGWMLWLDRYGQLDLGQVLAPAITLAREGAPASRSMIRWLNIQGEAILDHAPTARVYAPDGEFPEEGDLVRQTDLATTFEALVAAFESAPGDRAAAVQAARDYFYRGPLAEAIVAASDDEGGYLTLDDFREFEAEIVPPISFDYDGDLTVFQSPPNSQGIAMLVALNILKGYDLGSMKIDDPDAVHLQVEAIKLAFADRYYEVGDPARIDIPVDELLSDEHAAALRERIDMAQAMAWPIDQASARSTISHTTTFHVVDKDGSGAAVTTSLGGQFYVIGDTGIHINERMQFLSIEDGNANLLTPGYKVRHTSCPYIALRDRRPFIFGGNTGVDTQPQAQMQQFLNVVEFELTAQEAVDRPRFVSRAFPSTNYPHETGNDLQMEEGFPDALIEELEARGHQITIGEGIFGAANMIIVAPDGGNADVGAESRSETAKGSVTRAER